MWWPGEEGRDRTLDRGKSRSKGMKQPQETEGGSWFGITKAAGRAELRLGAGAARGGKALATRLATSRLATALRAVHPSGPA